MLIDTEPDVLAAAVAMAGEDSANVVAHSCRALLEATRQNWPGGWRSGLAATAGTVERFAWARQVGCAWHDDAPRWAALAATKLSEVIFPSWPYAFQPCVELGEWFAGLVVDVLAQEDDVYPSTADIDRMRSGATDAIQFQVVCHSSFGCVSFPHCMDAIVSAECAGEATLRTCGNLTYPDGDVPFRDGRLVIASPLVKNSTNSIHFLADQAIRFTGLMLRDAAALSRRLGKHGSVTISDSWAICTYPSRVAAVWPLAAYDWRVDYPARWRAAGSPLGGLNGLVFNLGTATPDYLRANVDPEDDGCDGLRALIRQPNRDGVVWDLTFVPDPASGWAHIHGYWDALLSARADDAALATIDRVTGQPSWVPFVDGVLPLLGPLLVLGPSQSGVYVRSSTPVVCRVAILNPALRVKLFGPRCTNHVTIGGHRVYPGPPMSVPLEPLDPLEPLTA